MSLGWVQMRGFGFNVWISSLRWMPDDREENGRLRKLLSLRRLHRPALACYECGAVVIEPDDAQGDRASGR